MNYFFSLSSVFRSKLILQAVAAGNFSCGSRLLLILVGLRIMALLAIG
ncbi:MAG: hypothetical protein WBA89_00560 [Microcoleus sp.]